jgi:hypothetical protein
MWEIEYPLYTLQRVVQLGDSDECRELREHRAALGVVVNTMVAVPCGGDVLTELRKPFIVEVGQYPDELRLLLCGDTAEECLDKIKAVQADHVIWRRPLMKQTDAGWVVSSDRVVGRDASGYKKKDSTSNEYDYFVRVVCNTCYDPAVDGGCPVLYEGQRWHTAYSSKCYRCGAPLPLNLGGEES